MGIKASPAGMRATLESIASGRLAAIHAATLMEAWPEAIKSARAALGECVHCRSPLLSRCPSCDKIHERTCCSCQTCGCNCCGDE